jgi:hypothetical protein
MGAHSPTEEDGCQELFLTKDGDQERVVRPIVDHK